MIVFGISSATQHFEVVGRSLRASETSRLARALALSNLIRQPLGCSKFSRPIQLVRRLGQTKFGGKWKSHVRKPFSSCECACDAQIFSLLVPGPVKGVSVTPISPESVQVRWQIPDDPNGVISGYDLTYKLLSRGQCGGSPEREITVTTRDLAYVLQNLVPHSRYRLTVAAKTRGVGTPVTKDFETDQSGRASFTTIRYISSFHF